jgi:hypothetical protein
MQDIAKKDHEDDLQELRLLFPGNRYDNRPRFISLFPTYLTRGWNWRMTEFDAQSLQFTNACRTSLSEHLRGGKTFTSWRSMTRNYTRCYLQNSSFVRWKVLYVWVCVSCCQLLYAVNSSKLLDGNPSLAFVVMSRPSIIFRC